MRSAPTAIPIIMRRTGLSAAQQTPLTKAATPKCQTASASRLAKTASSRVPTVEQATISTSTLRSAKRSAAPPMKAPNRPMGSRRNMPSMATTKADSVTR